MGHVLSALALALIHHPKSSSISFRWRHPKQGELITAASDYNQVASRPPDICEGAEGVHSPAPSHQLLEVSIETVTLFFEFS